MRVTNGAASATRRTSKRAISVVVAGGAVTLVLVGSGTAMASTLHGGHFGGAPSKPGVSAGHQGGHFGPPAPVSGRGHYTGPTSTTTVTGTGWNRVSNTPAPTPTPAPSTGGHSGTGGLLGGVSVSSQFPGFNVGAPAPTATQSGLGGALGGISSNQG